MNESQILQWIKDNLGPIIQKALADSKEDAITEDWMAAIAMRETGELIARYAPQNLQLAIIASMMKGDYTQRPADSEKCYHGFGFWQIDVDSFKEFVQAGLWKDPYKTCMEAILILQGDRRFIASHFTSLDPDAQGRAITAAYNCGAGNVRDVLNEQHDIDIRTTGKNYSSEVWRFRDIYTSL